MLAFPETHSRAHWALEMHPMLAVPVVCSSKLQISTLRQEITLYWLLALPAARGHRNQCLGILCRFRASSKRTCSLGFGAVCGTHVSLGNKSCVSQIGTSE